MSIKHSMHQSSLYLLIATLIQAVQWLLNAEDLEKILNFTTISRKYKSLNNDVLFYVFRQNMELNFSMRMHEDK